MMASSLVGLTIATAIVTFSVTNIDDFCLLIVYFAEVKSSNTDTNWNVCLGQSLGFTIILCISMLGIVLGSFIPGEYVSLIGFVPILVGLKGFYELLKEKYEAHRLQETVAPTSIESIEQEDGGNVPQKMETDETMNESSKCGKYFLRCFPPQIIKMCP